MTENEQDIVLLRTDPNRLIMKHQKMIRAVARTGLDNGWFPASEFADVTQTINLELLARIETVRQNYDGRAFLRTYLSQIALNICRRYHKDHPVTNKSPQSLDYLPAGDRVFEKVLIDEARERFRAVLLLFGRRLPKILLFLKIFYRYPISRKDVLDCYPHCEDKELGPLLTYFAGDYSSSQDQEIMAVLTPFANKMENSSTSADGYRRWIGYIVAETCDILNGDPPRAQFGRETFSLLFEDYCFRFQEKKDIRK